MPTIQEGQYRALPAGEDLSSVKYYFVTRESDQTVDVADSITDNAMGVLQNSPPDKLEANVKVLGQTKVVAGETLAIGDFVAPASDGRAQIAVETQFPRGRVVVAGNAGDLAVIELFQSADDIGGSDTFTTITMTDGGGFVFGTSTGSTIGGAANQKVAFWGATPVIQPTHNADPSKTAADPSALTATDPAANAGPTQGTYNSLTNLTDPPTKAEVEGETALIDAELDKIKVDIAAGKTAADANNAAIDALIIDLLSIHTQLIAAIADVDDNNESIDELNADAATTGATASS